MLLAVAKDLLLIILFFIQSLFLFIIDILDCWQNIPLASCNIILDDRDT